MQLGTLRSRRLLHAALARLSLHVDHFVEPQPSISCFGREILGWQVKFNLEESVLSTVLASPRNVRSNSTRSLKHGCSKA